MEEVCRTHSKHPSSAGNNPTPLELYTLLKDTSDYAWYTTSLALNQQDLPRKASIQPVLRIASLGHALHLFVNGEVYWFRTWKP
ncbi:hypothetical protein Prudu_000076 [Prunus dulcis]|uniref:Uncharacterized protein n=1 Tax=Prunus dulcis TaxID=3755 RepID=A0A4Y1QKG4_PRUDU|nr:hypothetical protein Prudu_000076 [Prunus dulcis]